MCLKRRDNIDLYRFIMYILQIKKIMMKQQKYLFIYIRETERIQL